MKSLVSLFAASLMLVTVSAEADAPMKFTSKGKGVQLRYQYLGGSCAVTVDGVSTLSQQKVDLFIDYSETRDDDGTGARVPGALVTLSYDDPCRGEQFQGSGAINTADLRGGAISVDIDATTGERGLGWANINSLVVPMKHDGAGPVDYWFRIDRMRVEGTSGSKLFFSATGSSKPAATALVTHTQLAERAATSVSGTATLTPNGSSTSFSLMGAALANPVVNPTSTEAGESRIFSASATTIELSR